MFTKLTLTDYAIVVKNKLQKNLHQPTLMTAFLDKYLNTRMCK
jgi:hypothetical protein